MGLTQPLWRPFHRVSAGAGHSGPPLVGRGVVQGQTAALVPSTPFWEDLTCSLSGRGMGFLECTSSDLVPAQALHRGTRLPVRPALSRNEKSCCSLAQRRARKALVKSAEARKPKKEFLRGSSVGMYEPKTLTFLAATVQRNRQVAFPAAFGDREEPEGIFS
uniref:Uncharacterized protein n=1 Tax=Buteo japonicus TaxID=224669 RepID=A0A8B9Z411_9AVES